MENAKTTQPTLLGKPIQFVSTAAWSEKYGGLEAGLYIKDSFRILQKFPYDMLVFEMPDDKHLQIRLAGYSFKTNELDEKTVVYKTESMFIETFWLKIDDYGEKFVGTFLFPSEY